MNAYEEALLRDWDAYISGYQVLYDARRYIEYFNEGTYAYNPDDLFAELDGNDDEFFIRVYDDTVLIREFYNSLDEFVQWVEKRESEDLSNA